MLPQAVVVEIVRSPELNEEGGPAGWYKGQFNWRSQRVALVSFEELCAVQNHDQAAGSLIAVLHTLQEDTDMRFYAFQLQAIPRSVSLDANSLIEVPDKEMNCEYISSETLIEGYKVVIPNLKRIEQEIKRRVNESAKD